MRRVLASFLTFVMLLPSITAAQIPPPSSDGIQFIPIMFKSNRGSLLSAELGRLHVPENRYARSGETITLPILKLKTKADRPGPPIVFLADGPGGIATNEGFILETVFQQFLETQEVILMDQRGAGRSKPQVYWESPTSLPSDYFLSYENMLDHDRWSSEQAYAHFQTQGIDLGGYNTIESVDDLNDLCLALGIDKVILIGIGYGAHLALETIRRYPDIIHSAVLVGTEGPDHTFKLPSTYDTQLKALSDLVAQDPAISVDMPDITALLRDILTQLDKKPIMVSVRDRKTRKMTNVLVGRFGLQWILSMEIGNRKGFSELPALLYTVSQGDYALLQKVVEKRYNQLSRGISGMSIMIDLHSGATQERMSRIIRESATSIFGNIMNHPIIDIGDIWGNPDLGNAYRAPVEADVPTLFISGALDTDAPPSEVGEIRKGFSNGVHCIVRYAGHEDMLSNKRVQQLIVDFLNGKDVGRVRISLGKPAFLPVP